MATVMTKTELQALVDSGMTVTEIAEKIHVNRAYVYKLIARFGIKYERVTKYTNESLNHIQSLFDQGLTIEQVAAELHSTYNAVQYAVRKYHLKISETTRVVPKLMRIRSQYFTEHMSVSAIADSWGVTEEDMRQYMTEHKILGRKTENFLKNKCNTEVPENYFEDWFHTCPVCNKSFAVRDCQTYAYKIVNYKTKGFKSYYFCSWSCIQKYRKDHPTNKPKKEK